MSIYRLRSRDAIFGDRQELEKQEIYFASYDQLNDPLEGYADVFWHGDEIVWHNLLRHYLLCLDDMMTMAILCPDNKRQEFYSTKLPIFQTDEARKKLLSESGLNRINEVTKKFFDSEAVYQLLKYLSGRKTPIKKEALLTFLRLIQNTALISVIGVEPNLSLFKDSDFFRTLTANNDNSSNPFEKLIELSDTGVSDDTLFDVMYDSININTQEIWLINRFRARNEPRDIDLMYFIVDFPNQYLEQVLRLVYSRCYSACFVREPNRISMWSHYASNHTGICLVFKDSIRIGSIPPAPVIYDDNPVEIDFFRKLFRYNQKTLKEMWLTDRSGNKSEILNYYKSLSKADIDDYWATIVKLHLTKSTEWQGEDEVRAILTDTLEMYNEDEQRKFKYNFSDLDGIIFGSRTSIDDKLKAIEIIAGKCYEHNRTDFKFFQSRYDTYKKEMVLDELTGIRFRFEAK